MFHTSSSFPLPLPSSIQRLRSARSCLLVTRIAGTSRGRIRIRPGSRAVVVTESRSRRCGPARACPTRDRNLKTGSKGADTSESGPIGSACSVESSLGSQSATVSASPSLRLGTPASGPKFNVGGRGSQVSTYKLCRRAGPRPGSRPERELRRWLPPAAQPKCGPGPGARAAAKPGQLEAMHNAAVRVSCDSDASAAGPLSLRRPHRCCRH